MDELFNVEVIGTSRNKIDNVFFYFKTSKEDCNGWHYLAIELDAEKENCKESLIELNNFIEKKLKTKFDIVEKISKEEYNSYINSDKYKVENYELFNNKDKK